MPSSISDLAWPTISGGGMFDAYTKGRDQGEKEYDRETLFQIGAQAAKGDYSSAAKVGFERGDLKNAEGMKNFAHTQGARGRENEEKRAQDIAKQVQFIESLPAEQQDAMTDRLIQGHNIGQRLQRFGVDPNDKAAVRGFLRAQAEPYMTAKDRADVDYKNAQAGYYNERPRGADGGSTLVVAQRLMEENPGLTLEQAVTIAKRGNAVSNVDAGTETEFRDQFGRRVGSTSKNLTESERQKTLGKPAETREIFTADGKKQKQQWDANAGAWVDAGGAMPGEPIRVDAGTETVLIDPATRQEIGRVPKDVSGEAQQRAYGSARGETAAGASKAQSAMASADAKTDVVLQKIRQARPLVSNWSVGYGSMLSGLPASEAANLKAVVDTLKANAGFAELQQMRDNSPTGGALGQVAVQELAMLQASITSLEQAQGVQQFNKALDDFETFIKGSRERRKAAYEATYGNAARSAPSSIQPRADVTGGQGQIPPGAVRFLQGNPSADVIRQFEEKYGAGSAAQFLQQR